MINNKEISRVSDEISVVGGRIGRYATAMDNTEGMTDKVRELYEQFLFDEIGHLQLLALAITEMASGNERIDEAFAEGELTSVIGDKDEEESVE